MVLRNLKGLGYLGNGESINSVGIRGPHGTVSEEQNLLSSVSPAVLFLIASKFEALAILYNVNLFRHLRDRNLFLIYINYVIIGLNIEFECDLRSISVL